jgi:hypothetical protein
MRHFINRLFAAAVSCATLTICPAWALGERRVLVAVRADCAISAVVPAGWSFDGHQTLFLSKGMPRVQFHFDPHGAEITIFPSGIEAILATISSAAESQRAVIRAKEYNAKWPKRAQVEFEFDEAAPHVGVHDVATLSYACGRQIALALRYYPSGKATNRWREVFKEVSASIREELTKDTAR